MDLAEVISKGTMRAAAKMLGERGVRPTDGQTAELIAAMREEIVAGYDEAAAESKAALDACGLQMAKQSLNLNCNLFAVRALRRCGLITEGGQA
jgi:hypothetical protein